MTDLAVDTDGDGYSDGDATWTTAKVQMTWSQVSGPTKMVMATVTTPVESMLTIVQPHSNFNRTVTGCSDWTVMDTLTRTTPSQRIRHNGVMQTETVMGREWVTIQMLV